MPVSNFRIPIPVTFSSASQSVILYMISDLIYLIFAEEFSILKTYDKIFAWEPRIDFFGEIMLTSTYPLGNTTVFSLNSLLPFSYCLNPIYFLSTKFIFLNIPYSLSFCSSKAFSHSPVPRAVTPQCATKHCKSM